MLTFSLQNKCGLFGRISSRNHMTLDTQDQKGNICPQRSTLCLAKHKENTSALRHQIPTVQWWSGLVSVATGPGHLTVIQSTVEIYSRAKREAICATAKASSPDKCCGTTLGELLINKKPQVWSNKATLKRWAGSKSFTMMWEMMWESDELIENNHFKLLFLVV